MYRWIVRIRKWLRLIYEFFFILLIIDDVFILSEKKMLGTKGLLILGGILIVSYIARDVLSHAISLFIAHGILAIVQYYIMQNQYLGIVMILVTVGIFIDASMYMKRGYIIRRAFEFPGDVVFLGLLGSILAAYFHVPKLSTLGYIASIIMLTNFLFSLYLEGLANYMEMNRRVKGIPVKQLVSVNSFIVTTVIMIIVVTIFLADIFGLPEVVKGFALALLGILKILLIILSVLFSVVSGLFGTSYITPEQGRRQIEEVAREESIFGRIVYFILVAVLIIAAIFVLIKICSFIVRWLISKQERNNEMTEDLAPKKKKRIAKTHIEREDKTGVLSLEQKARRIYKKRVLSFRRFFLPDSSDTTGDIEEAMMKMLLENSNDNSEDTSVITDDGATSLTELYNAVRYGNAKVDKNYLAEMKKAK